MGIVPTLPPAVDAAASKGIEGSFGGLTVAQEEVLEDAREEAEQPLLTPKEVVADLAASDTEATEKSKEMGVENPTERVNKVADGRAEEKDVPIAAKEEGRKRPTPRDEAAKARAITVHIYQRRPTRVEASRKKTTEEQQDKAPEKKIEGGDERQERSVVGLPRRRRRLILADEPDEIEEEVILALIEELPSSGQLTPSTEIEDERKKGKEKEGESRCWPGKEETAIGYINTSHPRGAIES